MDNGWESNDKDSVGFTPIYRLGKRDAFLKGNEQELRISENYGKIQERE